MSWLCELCSSANDEKDDKCFVCGQPRKKVGTPADVKTVDDDKSKLKTDSEVYRTKKRKTKRKDKESFSEKPKHKSLREMSKDEIALSLMSGTKISFVCLITVSLLAVILSLILKTINGQLDSIGSALIAVFGKMDGSINGASSSCVSIYGELFTASDFRLLTENIKVISTTLISHIPPVLYVIEDLMGKVINNHLMSLCNTVTHITTIYVAAALTRLHTAIISLYENAADNTQLTMLYIKAAIDAIADRLMI